MRKYSTKALIYKTFLLFSQFVDMLDIIKGWLERSGIPYEYLTGKTKDRQKAVENFNNAIVESDNYEEMVNAVNDKKVVLSYHCGNSDCEEEIRQNTTIKTRVIHSYDDTHKCIYCGKPSKYRVYFGKQY